MKEKMFDILEQRRREERKETWFVEKISTICVQNCSERAGVELLLQR